MIYIVHGDNLASSRTFIVNLQEQNKIEVRKEFRLEDVTINEVTQVVNSIDMFGGKQMLVLDISKMGRSKVDEYVNILSSVPEDFLFIILSDKNLTKSNAFIKNAPKIKARVMQFEQKHSSNIFKFADHVFTGNRKLAYRELKQLILSGEDPIYIFTMLLYNLRTLAFCKFQSPEFDKLAPFVKSKVSKISSNFSTEQLVILYSDFYELDLGSKIGLVEHEVLVPRAVEKVLTYF